MTQPSGRRGKSVGRRLLKWSAWGCGTTVVLFVGLLIGLFVLLSGAVPKSYPPIQNPLPPPDSASDLGGGLQGFDSPYIGHTGSWDGKGGAMFGASKIPDLDVEVGMGLRWTFMCVYWRVLEPEGPVDLDAGVPEAWKSLDEFVAAARERDLNILMQAPVVGGNAGGPPEWAGRRQPGRSAPIEMDALAEFAGKLAARYCPGGNLAKERGWGSDYGVRAWEMDNEPESYFTNWKGQAGDYAEFVTKASARIKAVDSHAVILTPAVASGPHAVDWTAAALDAYAMKGSEVFRGHGQPYSLGPVTDVVSFHNYEGLNTFFAGEDYPVTRTFQEIREVFEAWQNRSAGFEYGPKQEYWHTEGNFDFVGALSESRRAAWRLQFFTRAFAAGIRKVTVMDAKPLEQIAVRTYAGVLPNPFPMLPATDQISVIGGQVTAFRHPDDDAAGHGQVWILWADAGGGDAVVEVPVTRDPVEVWTAAGETSTVPAREGRVRLSLPGDAKMSPPVLVADRAE